MTHSTPAHSTGDHSTGDRSAATGPVAAEERHARAALTRVAEPGDPGLVRFVADHGAEETWEALRTGRYDGNLLAGYQRRLAGTQPERDLANAARIGARLVCPGDPEWPESFADLDHAGASAGRGGVPLALWVRGRCRLSDLTSRACAVVGARAATDYGAYVAAELASGLADRSITVISGGALGIDAAAHRGALAADGATVAFLASGVDVSYPRGHRPLFEQIIETGLLVSEVPPGVPPTRSRFLVRNRLIAAVGQGTVVVEAALRSGALNTASWTTECHRELMVVPGPVTSPASAGAHILIRDHGAVLVTDAAEVAEQVGRLGADLAPPKRGEQRPRDELDTRSRQVLDAVPVLHPRGVAVIATAAALEVQEALAVLGRLSLLGYVEQHGAGWRLSTEERQRRRHSTSLGPGTSRSGA